MIPAVGIALTVGAVASQFGSQSPSSSPPPTRTSKPASLVLETMGGPKHWDLVGDVVVVGGGCAGLMAAVSALWSQPELNVLLLEKSPVAVGGTTAKSGGVFWLPNNVEMQSGKDNRESTIRLMARKGFPHTFNVNSPTLGLEDDDYSKLCQYYDVSRPLSARLKDISYRLNRVKDSNSQFLYDYQYSPGTQHENASPQERHLGVGLPTWQLLLLRTLKRLVWLTPILPQSLQELNVLETMGINLEHGLGVHLVDVLLGEFTKLGGKVRLGAAVDALVLDHGAAVGVRLRSSPGGSGEFIGAKRGVVFASGGFAQNLDRVEANVPFVQKTGAAAGSEGDFVDICEKLDADMVDMEKIWGCEVVYETDPVGEWETPTCLFQMRGDSFFVVGPTGERVYNEKLKYDLRAKKHWEVRGSGDCESTEEGVFFLIGDHECVSRYASEMLANTWPRLGDPRYITGTSMPDLASKIQIKFPQFVHSTRFASNLPITLARFNQFAESGVDLDFGRGSPEFPSQAQWTVGRSNKNVTMFPLATAAGTKYYALPLVASMIDTKGGPKVDSAYRVVKMDGQPVDRLFAAGNCAQNVTGDAYLSGGATLGAALVSGYVAGMQAVLRGPGGAKL
ncbi:hypothetical protein BASA81_005778 [Batrachochytrium salamandrivorans]|nr:hypothetical protein BASA81_005778 [Batrachochytrium salamandrivorans]